MQNNIDNPKNLFTIGSEVEVRSDSNGFGNSWYRAKIIEPPKPTENNEHFWIQYDNLVEEDDHSQLLKEQVHASFIRPLPPNNVYKGNKNPFELNDVVEAFHEAGWWVGVVKEVRELNKYLVAFASKDQIFFRKRQLRIHLDWIHGKWIHPRTKVSVIDNSGANTLKKKRGRPSKISHEFVKENNRTSSGKKSRGMPPNDTLLSKETLNEGALTPPQGKDKDRTAEQSSNLLETGRDGGRDERSIIDLPLEAIGNSSALSAPTSISKKGWPFSKTSRMWKTIDSLEIYQKMSKMPHFSPLQMYDVNMREKLAIDMMIKFAYEAERIFTLSPTNLNDSNTINDIMNSLRDLEPHGFDTMALEEYLRKLCPEVHRERELKHKLEKVETKIVKCQQEKKAAEIEMIQFVEHIESVKKIKDQELARLDAEKCVISNAIRSLQLHFQKKI